MQGLRKYFPQHSNSLWALRCGGAVTACIHKVNLWEMTAALVSLRECLFCFNMLSLIYVPLLPRGKEKRNCYVTEKFH
ncbi:hypothetical protein CEXT_660081 [Caerostris extrusa]|uniref:Uncharacterized protein n=1 Tax=Caerostris extrusa TaxID=172846 RepID=A0AAV4VCJ5_CAEEX|nr:hypothetical protein CEXT_660081 [Caerostris extrusa]